VLLAQAYALAVSYPDSLPAFVARTPGSFRSEADVIRCGQRLVKELYGYSAGWPAPDSVERVAMELANQARHAELGAPVARLARESGTDLKTVGRYLESLVFKVLPGLAENKLEPYAYSEVYDAARFVWSSIARTDPALDIPAMRELTRQLSEWYIRMLMTEAAPGVK
jgi:hypothetical protein